MLKRNNSEIAFGSLAGNFLEHYDTALYSFLSPFFAEMFFSELPPAAALALAFFIIPISMVIKPLGGLFFGMIGDRYGRKVAFSYSLIGMGMSSFSFAIIPFYISGIQSGILILTLLRTVQNFFSSGGSVGGAIYLLENTEEKKSSFLSSLYSSTTIWGMMFASLGIVLIGDVRQHWHYLYLVGGAGAILGLFLKTHFPDEERKEGIPLLSVFTDYSKEIFYAAVIGGFSYMTFSYVFVLMVGLAPLLIDVTREEMIKCNTWFLGFDGIMLPIFGLLAVRYGGGTVMRGATLAAFCLALPIFLCMRGGSFMGILASQMLVLLIGVAFSAPLHSWMQTLVPTNVRYRVLGVGYSLGSQILGAPSAGIAMWSYYKTGSLAVVAAWWMILAAITYAVLYYRDAKVTIRSPVLSRS